MTMGLDRLPFFIQGRRVEIERVEVFAKGTPGTSYNLELSYTDRSGASVASTQITAAPEAAWGGAQTVSIGQTDAGLDLEQLDIEKAIALKLKRTTAMAFTGLATDFQEFENVFLILHYKLAK